MARSRMPHVKPGRVQRFGPRERRRSGASRRLAVAVRDARRGERARHARCARPGAAERGQHPARTAAAMRPRRSAVRPAAERDAARPSRAPARSAPGGIRFEVKGFEFTGNTVFPAAGVARAADRRHRPGPLARRPESAAARMTAYYRAHGYLVARAYVPPQQIDHGVVRIAISEGRYGAIDAREPVAHARFGARALLRRPSVSAT